MIRPLATSESDCWNRIGLSGDRSCPALDEHVHCRNCPVYSRGASLLLDRELPSNYHSGWRDRLAKVEVASSRASSNQSMFIFRLGAEWLALPTHVVEEVIEVRTAHSIPHRRNRALLGLVSVRGELLIAISLHHVLGVDAAAELPAAAAGPVIGGNARMLVLGRGGSRIVVRADQVHGPERCGRDQLLPAPATVARAAAAFTSLVLPWQSTSVGILDEDRLLGAVDRMLA